MSEGRPPDGERTQVVATTTLTGAVPQAEPRDHYLLFVEGAAPGLRVKLGDKPLRIGRHASCDLPLADNQVSSRHCELSLQSLTSAIRVEDLGSTNGTFVEGRRVQGTGWLAPGEAMRIGAQLIRHEHLLRSEAARFDEQQRDIEKARHYVESLLPAPVTSGPVRTDWCYVPSTQLGGDAFGYHSLDERTFIGYLIDVSGHGVGAAMHSVSVMNVMRQRALPGCDFHDPSQVLRSLNDMFQMEDHDGMYFSMWYGVYDTGTRRLRYASAGHHASYLVSADRARSEPLRTRNVVIGAMPPGHAFAGAETAVEAEDMLYVFSDGVFEVEAADGRQLALPDFLPLLAEPGATAGEESRRIHDAVRARARPGPLADDFTLLVVTFPSS